MFRKIALSVGISFVFVTATIAVFDYVRLLHRPVLEADWQLHYALLVATPIEAVMLAYAQALLDYALSPIPVVATASGAAFLMVVQFVANVARVDHPSPLLARWRAAPLAFVSLLRSKAAIGKLATKAAR